MKASIPIRTRHLFQELDLLLITKLKSISLDQWDCPTLAGHWTVKQVVAHLLDGNLRSVSIIRDGFFGEDPGFISSKEDLVRFLNRLNADWVRAMTRLSPQVLIALMEVSGIEYRTLINSLKPFEKALFSVAWAGERESLNWFHVAREYTEKWHHTQQIFQALDPKDQSLFSERFYLPYLETSFRAMPYHYQDLDGPNGTLIKITITGQFSHSWWLKRMDLGWQLLPFSKLKPTTQVMIPGELAWRMFTQGVSDEEKVEGLTCMGNLELAEHFFRMRAVMV